MNSLGDSFRRPLLAAAFAFGLAAPGSRLLGSPSHATAAAVGSASIDAANSDRSGERVFSETAPGLIAVEAEDFFSQTKTEKRSWHITDATRTPSGMPDIDPPHLAGASAGAYIEVLPDTGVDGQKLTHGENICDVPGAMAVAHYRVRFATPGRYLIWARAFGTDGDDNTLHFGIDDAWPASSARMHTYAGKKWQWACRHRQHKGKVFVDVPSAGLHSITISMREDGCELDRFLLVSDEAYVPPAEETGPRATFTLRTAPFLEREGLVVIEAESAPAASGWEYVAETGTGTDRGFLRWTVVGQGRKAAEESVLSYPLRITAPGTYQLLLRSRMPDPKNRLDTLDPDGNDVWVRFRGGVDVLGQVKLGDAWSKVAILGHPEGWTWNTHADRGPPHPPAPVCRHFDAPGLYHVELAGRSQGHAIDRLMLRRWPSQPVAEAEKPHQRVYTPPDEGLLNSKQQSQVE